jgi:hypothetical protein
VAAAVGTGGFEGGNYLLPKKIKVETLFCLSIIVKKVIFPGSARLL